MYKICEIKNDSFSFKDGKRRTMACGNGLVVELLNKKLKTDKALENGGFWKLDIANHYRQEQKIFVIEIKPNNEKELFLCELLSIFGYSSGGWTPIMLRMNKIVEENTKGKIEKQEKSKSLKYTGNINEIIYTFLYLNGDIKDRVLYSYDNNEKVIHEGKRFWSWPGPSPTNSVLFWPEAFSEFIKVIRANDPRFIRE